MLLSLSAAFSVSGKLHQSLHHGGAADGHFCLLCCLAKGHVSTPEVAQVSPVPIQTAVTRPRQPFSRPLTGFDYALPPGRAPPRG